MKTRMEHGAWKLALMPFGNSIPESQGDSGSKPSKVVERNELRWENASASDNPNRVGVWRPKRATTPLGLKTPSQPTQGSSFLATLGWRTQSRWDCSWADFVADPSMFVLRAKFRKALELVDKNRDTARLVTAYPRQA